jgi:hypothetical protein
MNLDTRIDAFRSATGVNIFERRGGRGEPGGYKFVCPGVMLGDDNVDIALRGHQWHLSYTDEGGRSYAGRADSQVGAYLALIADRYGLVATFTDKPDADEETA